MFLVSKAVASRSSEKRQVIANPHSLFIDRFIFQFIGIALLVLWVPPSSPFLLFLLFLLSLSLSLCQSQTEPESERAADKSRPKFTEMESLAQRLQSPDKADRIAAAKEIRRLTRASPEHRRALSCAVGPLLHLLSISCASSTPTQREEEEAAAAMLALLNLAVKDDKYVRIRFFPFIIHFYAHTFKARCLSLTASLCMFQELVWGL
jgi:hypothetical protein